MGINKKLYPLTPNSKVENNENYKRYLDEALEDKTIHNIALSGSYGSGKSSILSTYINESNYKDKIIEVSLANFNNDLKEKDKAIQNIEKNIINQILYQIPIKNIPLTNFRTKNEIGNGIKFFLSIQIIFIMLMFTPFYIYPEKYKGILYLLTTVCLFFDVFVLFNYLPAKKITLRYNDIETDILGKNDELFEKYADEIIYLLEKSNKNILVIEDLDRFNTLSIFEKLRELNIKLNNKMNLKNNGVLDQILRHFNKNRNANDNRFVFIYTIKDDLFENNCDRTKFFDLIIPVIPYLNYTNSYEKMKDLFKDENIEDELIYLLCHYINDNRTLYNIYNEYIVFNSELKQIQSDNSKLLALIAYKNIYNMDFEKLKTRDGELYRIITSVEEYKVQLRKEISVLKSKLVEIEKIRIENNTKTEQDIFVLWFKDHGDSMYSISQIIHYFSNPNQTFNCKIDNKRTTMTYTDLKADKEYSVKLDILTNIKTIEETNIENKISDLECKISGRIEDLIQEEDVEPEYKMIYRLIKNGYINEKYEDYINYYYADRNNYNFINSIFNDGENIGFDVKLNDFTKIDNILSDSDYKKEAILNFDLLDHLINQKSEKVKIILNIESNSDNGFIEQFYNLDPVKILPYLIESSIKLDCSKINYVSDEIVFNKLYIDNTMNYDKIISDCLKQKSNDLVEVLEFLNCKKINLELKQYFIPEINIKIDLDLDLDLDLEMESLYDDLISNNKVNPSSKNLNTYTCKRSIFSDNSLLANFINKNEVEIDESLGTKFYGNLLDAEGIDYNKYKEYFSKYNFELLDDNEAKRITDNKKIQILVELHKFVINEEVIEIFNDKNIKYLPYYSKEVAKLMIKNEEFIKLIDFNNLDLNTKNKFLKDLELICESEKISDEVKNNIIKKIN